MARIIHTATSKPTCSIEGCNRPVRSLGMCAKHHLRQWRGNDPTIDPLVSKSAFDRLFERAIIQDNGCWEYIGTILSEGYGQISIDKKPWLAHRAAYDLVIGDIPDGIEVCHTCDNRRCVNPEHLFLGTRQDNEDDKTKKLRRPKGEECATSLLKEAEVRQIKKLLTDGKLSQQYIANLFGVSRSAIKHIKFGESWSWLE